MRTARNTRRLTVLYTVIAVILLAPVVYLIADYKHDQAVCQTTGRC